MGARYQVGNLLSSDRFYGDDGGVPEALQANLSWKRWALWPSRWKPLGFT